MESTVLTSRLKLTLVTRAERGSPEFEWLHQLHSDEQTTWWSIRGQSKAIEDTENILKAYLPPIQQGPKTYRVVYAVHEILDPLEVHGQQQRRPAEQGSMPTRFIGVINVVSLDDGGLPLPEELTLPATAAPTTMMTEVAYMFLPIAWGKGYATESLNAVFEACKRSPSFWTPFSKVYVRAIVNEENPPSLRVMQKTGMIEKGVYEWRGKPVFLAGQWQERSSLHIFGMYLLE